MHELDPKFFPTPPEWAPDSCVRAATRLRKSVMEAGTWQHAMPIISRLLVDRRMQTVWQTLSRKKRMPDGTRPFEFPVETASGSAITPPSARQEAGMSMLFELIALLAINGFKSATADEVKHHRNSLLNAMSDMMKTGQMLVDLGLQVEAETIFLAVHPVAARLNHTLKDQGEVGVGLVSIRGCHDPEARGLAIASATLCRQIFGTSMESVSKTIAEVALGRCVPTLRIRPRKQ